MGLISRVSSRTYRMVFGVRLATALPIVLRWIGTPIQIYVKRRAESNPTFRKFISNLAQRYNKTTLRIRLKANQIHRTEQQINDAAKLSEDKAIMMGSEILSSTIGTFITLSIMGISYHFFNENNIEKLKEEENLKAKQVEEFEDLRLAVKRIETNIAEFNKFKDFIRLRLD